LRKFVSALDVTFYFSLSRAWILVFDPTLHAQADFSRENR